MLSGHFFLAVLFITIAISSIQWLFIGFLFHKYQAPTPQTWRKETGRSYALSTLLSVFFAYMFTFIFFTWKSRNGAMGILDGIEFSLICWLGFSIPLEIGNAIYVNYSRMFVFGKCISSLVEYTSAGIIASLLL